MKRCCKQEVFTVLEKFPPEMKEITILYISYDGRRIFFDFLFGYISFLEIICVVLSQLW